MIATLRVTS